MHVTEAARAHQAAALAYYDLGLCPVLLHGRQGSTCSCGDQKCAAPGKHPRLTDWAAVAAGASREQVADWWTRYPDAHVGLLTGDWSRIAAPGNRHRVWIIAIDVDARPLDASGRTGLDTWGELIDEHGQLGETWEAKTPSGGAHFVLRHPGKLVPTRSHVWPGVDVRADRNGQIVVSPSEGYGWDCNPARVSLGSCPSWLVQAICAERAGKPQQVTVERHDDEPGWPDVRTRIERARRYLARCPVAIAGQRGHDVAWQVARSIVRGFALEEEQAMDALQDWNNACVPPWSEKELGHKVRSAAKDARGLAWGAKLLRTETPGTRPAHAPAPPPSVPGDPPPEDTPEAAEAVVEGAEEPGWMASLLRTRSDKVLSCEANAVAILGHAEPWAGVLAWDAFEQSIAKRSRPPWHDDVDPGEDKRRLWIDSDTTRAVVWLQREWQMRLGADAVHASLQVVAERHTTHPVRAYLDGLKWDGDPRLDRWIPTYLGAEDTEYAREVGRMALISAVARIYRPGCKVDTMMILEGPQGARKSTALRTLFGDAWFSDTPIDLESKDRFVVLRGKWCIELAELDSLRRSDATRIKSFLSSSHDDYRPPFGRLPQRIARQCIFAGTTNADTYLRDETGARRFWPVRCGTINVDALAAARDQLWAEAREAFSGGGRWWPEGELIEQCREETEARSEGDSWSEKILPWLERKMPGYATTIGEVLSDAVGLEVPKHDRAAQMRVGAILTRAGWHRVRVRVGSGRKEYHYTKVALPALPCGPTSPEGEAT